MTTKMEKNGKVKVEAQSELKMSQKKVKSLEKQVQILLRKNCQLEGKMESCKKENVRLLDVIKKHQSEANLRKKEAHRLLFENAKFSNFVSDKDKTLSKDLDASEVKFVKMKESFEKASNQVNQMRIKNEAIKLDISLKMAEAELKRDGMKREIAQLVIESDSTRAEEEMRANQQKSYLAMKNMEARLAGVQEKK